MSAHALGFAQGGIEAVYALFDSSPLTRARKSLLAVDNLFQFVMSRPHMFKILKSLEILAQFVSSWFPRVVIKLLFQVEPRPTDPNSGFDEYLNCTFHIRARRSLRYWQSSIAMRRPTDR